MLKIENVSFSYSEREKDAWALRGACLTLERGEIMGIAGRTGSGKSTLAQVASCLAKPAEGSVTLDGADLYEKRSAKGTRKRVGIVFQYPENQLFGSSVQEDVSFGPKNLGLTAQEAAQRADEALALVGLDPDIYRDASPFHLSGGQQRRIAIAGALAMRPDYLVLDEPTAGLDPKAKREFQTLIRSLAKGGTGIMLISHDMEDLSALCDRIAIMSKGRIIKQGTPSQVFAKAQLLEECGLTTLPSLQFVQKLERAGLSLPERDSLLDVMPLANAIAKAIG